MHTRVMSLALRRWAIDVKQNVRSTRASTDTALLGAF
uniref:Uncharacterized protein n=1 Tax=Setaria italica TaxID=4555 RepID=K3Y430_SETIT